MDNNMKAFKLFTLILILTITKVTAQNPAHQIDSLFSVKTKAAGIVGLSAAIVSDKGVLWSGGYGYADKEKQIPYTPETIMNIGSVSKSITGICIMRAVQENKLALDEDINKYLPFKVRNPYFPKAKITMRQLAVHTSGIQDREPVYSDTGYYYGGDAKIPLGEFLKDYLVPKGRYYADSNFVKGKPGTESYYSNIGAALAGYIVERVTGMKLNEYSKNFLFDPLGLKHTGWFLSDIDTSKHCRLYERKGDTLTLVPWYGLVTYPDGGVRTSVSDLSKILLSIIGQGQQVLSAKSRTELWHPNFTPAVKPVNYDYDAINYNEGIFWSMNDGMHKIGHVGRDPGINTYMYYDRSLKRGIIIFYNTSIPYKDRQQFETIYDQLWNLATSLKD